MANNIRVKNSKTFRQDRSNFFSDLGFSQASSQHLDLGTRDTQGDLFFMSFFMRVDDLTANHILQFGNIQFHIDISGVINIGFNTTGDSLNQSSTVTVASLGIQAGDLVNFATLHNSVDNEISLYYNKSLVDTNSHPVSGVKNTQTGVQSYIGRRLTQYTEGGISNVILMELPYSELDEIDKIVENIHNSGGRVSPNKHEYVVAHYPLNHYPYKILSGDTGFTANHPSFSVGDVAFFDVVERYNRQKPNGSITAFASGATASFTEVTSNAHGRTDGETINIFRTNDYDGTYTVTAATANTFEIETPFVTGDTGGWNQFLSPKHAKAVNFTGRNLVSGATSIKNIYNGDIHNNLVWSHTVNELSYITAIRSLVGTGADFLSGTTDYTVIQEQYSLAPQGTSYYNFSGNGSVVMQIRELSTSAEALSISYRGSGYFNAVHSQVVNPDFVINTFQADIGGELFPSSPTFLNSRPRDNFGSKFYYITRYNAALSAVTQVYHFPKTDYTLSAVTTGITQSPDVTNARFEGVGTFQSTSRIVVTNNFVSDAEINELLNGRYLDSLTNIKLDLIPDYESNLLIDVSDTQVPTEGYDNDLFSGGTSGVFDPTNDFIFKTNKKNEALYPIVRDAFRMDNTESIAITTPSSIGDTIGSGDTTVLVTLKFTDGLYENASTLAGWSSGVQTRIYSLVSGRIRVENSNVADIYQERRQEDKIVTIAMTNKLSETGTSQNFIYVDGVLTSARSNPSPNDLSGLSYILSGNDDGIVDFVSLQIYNRILSRKEIADLSNDAMTVTPDIANVDKNGLVYYSLFGDGHIYDGIDGVYVRNMANPSLGLLVDRYLNNFNRWFDDQGGTVHSISNNKLTLNTTGQTGTSRIWGSTITGNVNGRILTFQFEVESFSGATTGSTMFVRAGLSGDSSTIINTTGIYRFDLVAASSGLQQTANIFVEPNVIATISRINVSVNFEDAEITGLSGATVTDQYNTAVNNIIKLNSLR